MRLIRKISILSLMLFVLVSFLVVNSAQTMAQSKTVVKKPKYIFLFIGDGMSFPQMSSASDYLGKMKNGATVLDEHLNFMKFPIAGTSTTYDLTSFIPDSASAGTAIATGHKTHSGVIGMDKEKKISYESIAEKIKKQLGYKVGIVSSVSIDHATPASFYAHQPTRKNYYDIAIELAKSNFDYFGGGGFKQPTGKNKNQTNVLEIIKENGYKVYNTKEEILNLNAKSGKVIAINPNLDEDKALPYSIDQTSGDLSLAQFTKKGIEVLKNDKGFFMMVEGGKIDWACHANDAITSIKDTLAFADAVNEAIEFYNQYPDETLIIVTADHETGGLTLGFSATGYSTYFDKLASQKMSYYEFDKKVEEYKTNKTSFKDVLADIKTNFGLITKDDANASLKPGFVLNDYEYNKLKNAYRVSMLDKKQITLSDKEDILYGHYEPLSVTVTHILNNKAGMAFTSYSHTALPVPVFAKGVDAGKFSGFYDNIDIFKKIQSILQVK